MNKLARLERRLRKLAQNKSVEDLEFLFDQVRELRASNPSLETVIQWANDNWWPVEIPEFKDSAEILIDYLHSIIMNVRRQKKGLSINNIAEENFVDLQDKLYEYFSPELTSMAQVNPADVIDSYRQQYEMLLQRANQSQCKPHKTIETINIILNELTYENAEEAFGWYNEQSSNNLDAFRAYHERSIRQLSGEIDLAIEKCFEQNKERIA